MKLNVVKCCALGIKDVQVKHPSTPLVPFSEMCSLKRDFYASSVDTLVNDDYYYAEALTDTYDDSFLFQLDSSFLAAINGVWNTGELYRDIMIEYFSAYESNDTMEDAQRTALIDDFLDPLMENASDVKNVIKSVPTSQKMMKM